MAQDAEEPMHTSQPICDGRQSSRDYQRVIDCPTVLPAFGAHHFISFILGFLLHLLTRFAS